MAAGGDAGDRLERRRRLVDGDVEPFVLEVALVLGNQEERGRPFEAAVEREFDVGLRRRGLDQHERRREQRSPSGQPREVEEAHGYSLYSGPASPRPRS